MELAIRLVGSGLAVYGAAYFVTAMVDRERFVDHFSLNEAERHQEKQIKFYVRMGVTILGCGFFMYAAAYSVFQFIPHDWGRYDEYGEWVSTRHGLQFMFAMVATLSVVSALEKDAKFIAVDRIEKHELRAIKEVLRLHASSDLQSKIDARVAVGLKRLEEDATSASVRRECREALAWREYDDRH